jgi:glycosyltransferase involved in cell wall biosynthesis
MVSIVLPVFNNRRLVGESIRSALCQSYADKEIIVIDDCSTDDTVEMAGNYAVRLYRNERNLGLGGNLSECVMKAKGDIIIILCQDDIFTHNEVVSDMVKIFEANPKVGVIGRYYYQYLDGYEGAVMTIRGNIYTSSCQPSGIGFRKEAIVGNFTNKLFIEVPDMVKKVISSGWDYHIIKYDTIAARLHPGVKGNAATSPSYYKVTPPQSPTLNWLSVTPDMTFFFMGFIQLKNRAPWLLLNEIWITIMIKPKVLLNIGFWFCALVAIIVPGCVLRRLSNFYRHRITRRFCKIIEREV